VTRTPRSIAALVLPLIGVSGCADAVGRAIEDVVRTSLVGVQELGSTRPGAILAAGELRCDETAEGCEQGQGGTRGCRLESEHFSAELGEEFASCVDACGEFRACFDEALATATEGTSPSAESARCSERLAECAVTSDACGALDALSDEPLRAEVIACADVPCEELQVCLRDALLSGYDTEG
jgi:hypothetical protein